MKCEEARRALWPLEEPRLANPEVVEAHKHVAGCRSCREFLDRDEPLLEVLRRSRRLKAPAEVRQAVLDALRREREREQTERERGGEDPRQRPDAAPGAWPLVGGSVGLAVALASIALVGVLFPRSAPSPSASAAGPAGESAFVEDFLRRAVQAEHIETSDPSEVARFLSRELGVAGAVPMPIDDFELTGAEVCIVEGVRGAVILYKQDGRVLYHYLIPKRAENESPPAPSGVQPPQWSGEVALPAVVTWGSETMQQALVGDLPQDELLALARSMAAQG